MSKVLMVIAQSMFRDEELFETKAELTLSGHKVTVASRKLEICHGNQGGTAMPDIALDDVVIGDYDALVFVGGGGAKEYFEDEKVWDFAREAYDSGKVLGAICIAPVILAKAGLLKDKNATVFPTGEQDLIHNGAFYTGESVTQDGNIVTGNGPKASVEFARKIDEMLEE
jgi:protease I